MNIIYGNGNTEFTVPTGQKVAISAENATCVVYYSSFPNSPEMWREATRFTSSAALLGTFDADRKVRLEVMGGGNVTYKVGADPKIVSRYDDKIGIGVIPATQALDIDGNIQLTGTIIGGGSIQTIIPVTNGVGDPYEIEESQSGYVFTNEGAAALVYIELPLASEGLVYNFVVVDSDGMRIIAQSGDTIRQYTENGSSGGYIYETTVGATIRLEATNDSGWIVSSAIGVWTPG